MLARSRGVPRAKIPNCGRVKLIREPPLTRMSSCSSSVLGYIAQRGPAKDGLILADISGNTQVTAARGLCERRMTRLRYASGRRVFRARRRDGSAEVRRAPANTPLL